LCAPIGRSSTAPANRSSTEITGSAAQEHQYRASIVPPPGVSGFVIYAVAYDVMGQEARSQNVRVGKIDDTVEPRLEMIEPFSGQILTETETIDVRFGVSDIGVVTERGVEAEFVREFQPDVCEFDADCSSGSCINFMCRPDCDPSVPNSCPTYVPGTWLPLATRSLELDIDATQS